MLVYNRKIFDIESLTDHFASVRPALALPRAACDCEFVRGHDAKMSGDLRAFVCGGR